MEYSNIRYNRNSNIDFYKTLQKRVRRYFKYNKITHYGNRSMVVKSIFMLALYIVPFILLLTVANSVGIALLMWALMTLGMSGIGLSIMHDANHGAYSKRKKNKYSYGLVFNAFRRE